MKKSFMNLYLLILLIYPLSSLSLNDLSEYCPEIVQKIKIGDKEGELGLEIDEVKPFTLSYGPMVFTENDTIYIFDSFNQRVNIYIQNFLYLQKIDLNYKKTRFFTAYIDKMIVDKNENIFIISAGLNGTELLIIKRDGSWERLLDHNKQFDFFATYDFFSIGDRILYYDKEDLKFIDLIENKTQVNKNTENNISYILDKPSKNGQIKDDVSDRNKMSGFLQKNKTILQGNRLLSKNLDRHQKYHAFLKTNLKIKRNTAKINIDKKIDNPTFLGFDSDDNSYWKGSVIQGTQLFIFNKYGEAISIVKLNRAGNPVISPAGDIYYLGGDGDRIYVNIYKITRCW